MYLSKLEIVGFKSFAQKVNLTFDSGISAIVGPNGCGKTNIVDAIRWVLGEQRYTTLRSDKMEDVIFNGTKTRKPLGMAEATLVIENTRGILPSEYSQVTIGRRVYRSGESEYLLNKIPCRLKDILDLFMDTGMGSDAYSVIELKMVETILSDRTDERRRLFEEAAGVTKYKHRRKAAYRKLEDVQADLVRVNDIVAEVQKAVSSLERQARKAEQYNEVKERLRTLEVDLMEREYAQFSQRMTVLRGKLDTLRHDSAQLDVDLTGEETRLEEFRTRLLGVERRVAEAQRDVSLQREKIHRVERTSAIAAERTSASQANISRFEREQAAMRSQTDQLVARTSVLAQRIGGLRMEEVARGQELDHRKGELQRSGTTLDTRRADLQSMNERMIALVREIAERQAEQDKKRARVENLAGRIERTQEESFAYEEELVRLDNDITARTDEDRQLRRTFAEAEMRYYDAEAQRKRLKDEIAGLQQKVADTRSEMERRLSRIEFLQGLIESREGLSDGIRYLSASSRWTPSRNMLVADALHAEEKFRPALEAALGDLASLIVVDSERDALSGIEVLREDQRGKATFVCLDRLPLISARASLPAMPGVYGWAIERASFDPIYAPLFQFLLDRVLIVEDTGVAARVVGRMPGIRAVTLDGEVVTGAGIKRGGSRRSDEGGLIGKRHQIEELKREASLLEERLANETGAIELLEREHDAIDLKALADAVKDIEKLMNGVEMRIAQLAFEKKRAADVIARNEQDLESLTAEVRSLEREIESESPGIALLSTQREELEQKHLTGSAELQALEEEWNGHSAAVNELGIALVRLRGEITNAENEVVRAEQTLASLKSAEEKLTMDAAEARATIETNAVTIQENAGTLEQLQRELSGLETRRTEAEEEAAAIRDEAHQIELRIRDRRRIHDDTLKHVHELELQLAEVNARIEHLKSRAFEEFELELSLKTYPEDEFVDFAALRDEIPRLREKIRNLGNINFAAFEEFSEEKKRLEFITAQRNDLLEAEKTLLATIEEINTTAQRQFLQTFGKIRENFIETFKSLFDPGDECDLKLEEDVDPLEAKIEIVAKPRGKRPTSIDLLSGGEKTLTATALLFAIYLVKPSPFCILDEVDAPLDDANVDRFTRILRKFSDNTQFIVVTHNKRTMESANALYGVTMEEEGVSKIVTVRFNQSSQVAAAALASG